MTLTEAARTIDRLVADLARATGRDEKIVRLAYGLDDGHLDTLLSAAVKDLGVPATPACTTGEPEAVGVDDGECAA
ncbi:hypothetical protein N866_13090 [Actinotalea ferrariae CF5-4]|uniref:Uncharacterized protein n=1 Tax=Actinotalea ferrariae CF5-4 TaxID=948458 RepID=A0A021W1D3_9CELL|nr:hypothetical protein [Actinotalea ferrariae]EYR65142.1 hypothetical protein N866_13090 [Actinotalea ferrariae CF5-4]